MSESASDTCGPTHLMSGSSEERGPWWSGLRFDDSEYIQRHTRLRELLSRAELDAAVISDDRAVWYLTGFGEPSPTGSRARPRVLIAHQTELVLLVHRSTARCVEEMIAPGLEVETYDELGPPVSAIADRLVLLGAPRVAGELNADLVSGLGVADWRELEQSIGHRLESVSPVISRLRATKSPAEIQRVRRACAITGAIYDQVLPGIAVGATERDVCSLIQSGLRDLGADGSWATCVIGEYDRVDGVPRRRPAQRGDLVFVDAGANVGGYWADFSRAAVVGGPSEAQRCAQDAIVEITHQGVNACRKGTSAATVASVLDAAMHQSGLCFNTRPGRYGHGLGMDVTEAPDIAEGDHTELRPGYVVTIEPAYWRSDGVFHCEQVVLVTDTDRDVLTAACATALRAAQ